MLRRRLGFVLAVALPCMPLLAADEQVLVCAAASLKGAFTELGKELEAGDPQLEVAFNFGASGQLVQQVSQGAPCDVLATADRDSLERSAKDGRLLPETRVTFASNTLVLIVPVHPPSPVGSIADLGQESVRHVALGTPQSVPAGLYAKEALELVGQWESLQPKYVFAENVRQVLDYVARGEAEAGFVYSTDARLMQEQVRVVGAMKTKRTIQYPMAVVKNTRNEVLARRFVESVLSPTGQRILKQYGFGAP